MLRILTCLLAAALAAQHVAAKEPRLTRLPVPEYLLKLDNRTEFYGIYMDGHKIGWWRNTFRKGTFEDSPAIVWESEGSQSVINAGEVLESNFLEQEFFQSEPPYAFLGARNVARQADFDNTIDIAREGDAFLATVVSGDDQRTLRMNAIDYTFADIMTPEAWCLVPRKKSDAVNILDIDWEKMEASHDRYAIRRILDPGEGPDAPRYEIDYQSGDERERGEVTVSGMGIMLRGSMGGIFEMRLEPEEEAKDVEATYDMFAASLIKVDRPLGDASKVSRLVLDLVGPNAARLPSGGMQTCEFDEATSTARLVITSQPGAGIPVTEDELEECSEATLTFPSDDPKVVRLAKQAVGDARSIHAKVQRLVDFVDAYIFDDIFSEPPTVHDIIRTRRGDCTEHSALFVTLARAVGIPAREVNGFVYGEDVYNAFGGHAWCEVAIDGKWLPVDPSWGETTPNATHIRISSGPAKSEDLKIFLGGLEIKVIAVEHQSDPSSLLRLPSWLMNAFRGE